MITVIRVGLEQGITFFETAEGYSHLTLKGNGMRIHFSEFHAIIIDYLNQGNFGNLLKSGLRFSINAFFPSFASSDK